MGASALPALLAAALLLAGASGVALGQSGAKGKQPGENDLHPTRYLPEQNWDAYVRQGYYFTPQGSRIIPYSIAMALERADNNERFFTSVNLERYGYIGQAPSARNPDGLPIGFTKDGTRQSPALGMNCAACHTGELAYNGARYRIDGGASLADFQSFVRDMDAALTKTLADPAKQERLLQRIAGPKATENGRQKALAELKEVVADREAWEKRNSADVLYGAGRTDAFGVIFNQVLAGDLHSSENARVPNAPVSFPVLWDTTQHDFVQWVGLASNGADSGGPIARNIGQVLGVFGHVDLGGATTPLLHGYCSTARRDNLDNMEAWSARLESPQWPKDFPPVDTAKAAEGKKLFEDRCQKCHGTIQRDDPARHVTAKMVDISVLHTDPKVAADASERTAVSGILQGRKLKLISGRSLEAVEPAVTLLRHVVAGSIAGTISGLRCETARTDTSLWKRAGRWNAVFSKAVDSYFYPEEALAEGNLADRQAALRKTLMRYKARPLNGAWASAPYLHNGSVPSIYEILLPQEKRQTKFMLGCREFDPQHVGLDCGKPDAMRESEGKPYVFDTTIPGNSNQGHNVGRDLTDEQRWQLVEYIKTL